MKKKSMNDIIQRHEGSISFSERNPPSWFDIKVKRAYVYAEGIL